MSTAAPPPAPVPMQAAHPDQQVTVISHSNLFYWWPVWAIGLLMWLLTILDGHLMVTVPSGTRAVDSAIVKDTDGSTREAEGYVLPKGARVTRETNDPKAVPRDPVLHVARSKNYGVIFCVTLILVIAITNIPMRGMWSLVVIITIIMLSVIFALAGWWERIFTTFQALDIRINAGGYLFIATSVFIIWFVCLIFFDKQTYIVFEPGQFKVCTEVGGGEKVYDTMGMSLERQRSDLFRHMILGLGSGDLIVKTSGAQAHHFDLPNVLFISKKVQMIEDLLRQKKVVEQR